MKITNKQKNIILVIGSILAGLIVGYLIILIIKHFSSNSPSTPSSGGDEKPCVKKCDKTCGPSNCNGDPCGPDCETCKTCEEQGYQCGTFTCEGKNIICPKCEDGKHCDDHHCVNNDHPSSKCYPKGTNPFLKNNNCAKNCCDDLHLCLDSNGKDLICGDCDKPIIPECKKDGKWPTSNECCNNKYYCSKNCG